MYISRYQPPAPSWANKEHIYRLAARYEKSGAYERAMEQYRNLLDILSLRPRYKPELQAFIAARIGVCKYFAVSRKTDRS
jgi:hypothetical protein